MPTVSYGIANTADDVIQLAGIGLFDSNVANGTGSGFAYWAGLRFLGVAVPQGATINSATLTLRKDTGQSVAGTWGVLKGVAANTAPAWTTTDPQAASKTTQSVTIVDGATQNYDVAAIVQAIVNRAGWASGNALAFAGDPTGTTGLMAWIDRATSSTDCAQLSITYTAGGGGATYAIAGAVSGSGSAAGAIGASRSVRSAVNASAAAVGAILARRPVASTVAALGIATAQLLARRPATGAAAASAMASGAIGRSASIGSAVEGQGIAAGALGMIGADRPIDAAADATATATGTLQVSRPVAAAVQVVAIATGAINAARAMTGAATAQAIATGELGALAADGSSLNPLTQRRRRRSVR